MITVTTFKWVPPFARGLVRDLRVRWALEEAGLPYSVRLLATDENKSADYRMMQPFGQVPVIEDGDLVLFKSGAIVLHIAERSEALLPKEKHARERARAWVIAALNSIEPQVQQLTGIDLFHANDAWAKERRPQVEQVVKQRLAMLATWLGDKPYLEGNFTAGDLMMATVLRLQRHTDLITSDPVLGPYLARCEARSAFQRALAAQLAVFEESAAAQRNSKHHTLQ